jgi:hypothetical protein
VTPKICEIRLWKWTSVSTGAPLLGFWGKWKDAFLGPLRGGINIFSFENFYKEFQRYVKKRPYKRAALSIKALLG